MAECASTTSDSFECGWSNCSFSSKDLQEFKIHVLDHADPDVKEETGQMECHWNRCGVNIVDGQARLLLLRHLLVHCHITRLLFIGEVYRRENKLSCEIPSFLSKELLTYNIREPHACRWGTCEYVTDDVDDYFIHVNGHLKREAVERGNPWCCKWADCEIAKSEKEFANSGNLRVHLRAHTKEKRFACVTCLRQFASLENFRDHFIKQDMEKLESLQNLHKCKKCGVQFPRRPQLTAHNRQFHQPPRRCPHCPRSFGSASALGTHVESMHEKKQQAYQCSFCILEFKSRGGVLEHVRAVHQPNVLRCVDCKFESKYYSLLWQHIFKQHLHVYYSCHICGFRALRPYSFGSHLRNKHQISPPPGYQRFQYEMNDDGVYQLVGID